MKKYIYLFVISVFVFHSPSFGHGSVQQANTHQLAVSAARYSKDEFLKLVDAFKVYVEKARHEWNAPGIAIGIVYGDQIVETFGFGTRMQGKNYPVNGDTVFQIASLSKNLLAHLTAKMVQEKKISFDDPIIKYIPSFKIGDEKTTQEFTIRDALSHRSGLPGFSCDTLWYMGCNQQELIDAIGRIPLKYPFRRHYGYQNQVFGLVSLILEHVTGENIDTLYRRYFFGPLGMNSSRAALEAVKPYWLSLRALENFFREENIAHPHDIRDSVPHVLPFSGLNYVFAGSTGCSVSANDYTRWMHFMLNQGTYHDQVILDKDIYKELITPHIRCDMRESDMQFPAERYHNIHYGMGFFLFDYGKKQPSEERQSNEKGHMVKAMGHMGAFYGVRSLMMLCPKERLGIVVLSNLGSNNISMLPEALINRFMDMYLKVADTDWSQKYKNEFNAIRQSNKRYKDMERLQNPKPAGALEQYVGVFQNPLYGTCQIALKDHHLVLMYRDRTVQLNHFNGSQFVFEGYHLSPAFTEVSKGYTYFGGSNGKVTMMQIPSLFREGPDDGLFMKVDAK